MRKYKLEVAIFVIFVTLLVLLMWTTLAAKLPVLPFIVSGICALALVAVLIPWPQKNPDGSPATDTDTEKFAPRFFAQALVSSLVGIAIILGLGAVLNRERFSKTLDLTDRKVNSLSDETEKYLASLTDEVDIYCVGSMDTRERYCEDNQQLRRLYAEKSKKIQHAAIDLRDTGTLQKVKPAGYSRLVILSKDNRTEVVGKVTESKFTNALINLIKSKKTVYFLTGSGEPPVQAEGERSYAGLAEILKNRAYEVKEWNITQGTLPGDAALVVAGSNTVPYNSIVEKQLRTLLGRGGRLILTVNPYRDPGMPKLFADLGVKLENILLVNNGGATPLGGQLAQLAPMRAPIVVGEFSRESAITGVLSPRDIALVDGARPLGFANKEATDPTGIKIKYTQLASAMHGAPVTLTDSERINLPLDGSLGVKSDAGYNPNKTYPAGVQIEIENASKLAVGLAAAPLATPTPEAGKEGSPGAPADAKKPEPTDSAEVVLLGFDVAGPYERAAPANAQLLPLAVAHLYRDKELVSIPNKDFAPKSFNLERNPGAYLFLFSGLLPIATALTGFYIWMRRRSA